MLIYHPIFDVNHCVFRVLLVLESSQHSELDLDLFRIIDFYHIFPHLIKSIKPFPSDLSIFRAVIRKIPEPYELVSNVKRTMHELEAIQTTAMQNLMAKNLIDINSYNNRFVRRADEPLPKLINEKIQSSDVVNEEWFRMLINEFPTVNFLGKTGLKARTGLMEFRYDVEVT